jgi:hypothetical protein
MGLRRRGGEQSCGVLTGRRRIRSVPTGHVRSKISRDRPLLKTTGRHVDLRPVWRVRERCKFSTVGDTAVLIRT